MLFLLSFDPLPFLDLCDGICEFLHQEPALVQCQCPISFGLEDFKYDFDFLTRLHVIATLIALCKNLAELFLKKL